MKVNDIIILENEERFTLLAETLHENSRYFLAMGIDEQEVIDKNKIAVLKLVEEPDGAYVELVKNQELLTKLMEQIKDAK